MDGIETPGVFPFAFHREMADQILLFLVPLVIFQITGSVGWSGMAFFLETLPRYASFPICGALCDRISPLRLLYISQVYRAVACFGRQRIIPIQDFGKTTGPIVMLNNLSQPAVGLLVGVFAGLSGAGGVILGLSAVMGLIGALIAAMRLRGSSDQIAAFRSPTK
jgi:MFS family permease